MENLWNGYTELMNAAANGDLSRVTALIEKEGAEVNKHGGWNDTTALILASAANQMQVVQYFLRLPDIEIDAQNHLKNSALLCAAEEGHLQIVELLVMSGADITLSNEYKQTALILAIESNHLEIVMWIANYANVNYPEKPEQLNIPNKYGKTPLMVASEFGKYEIARWIISTGRAELNHSTWRKMNSLMLACTGETEEHEKIVGVLLDARVDVNELSKEKDTSLTYAALGGRVAVVSKLIEYGANVNVINEKGFTALMIASERGHEKVVELLIGHKAKKWIENKQGQNAMTLAWRQGHVDIATKYFMEEEHFDMFSAPISVVFSEKDLDYLAKLFSNPKHTRSLIKLVIAAAKHQFHFELFVSLIPRFQSPNGVVNKPLPRFFEELYNLSETTDVHIVDKLVQLAAAYTKAIEKHPMEKMDLMERYNIVAEMLRECVVAEIMDEEKHIHHILNYSTSSKTRLYVYKDDIVERAQAFHIGPLATSIRYHVTALFCSGRISTYVDSMFWGTLKKCAHTPQYKVIHLFPPSDSRKSHTSKNASSNPSTNHSLKAKRRRGSHGQINETTPSIFVPWSFVVWNLRQFSEHLRSKYLRKSENIRHMKSSVINSRYCPAAMFFGEGLAKFVVLTVVAHIATGEAVTLNREYDGLLHPVSSSYKFSFGHEVRWQEFVFLRIMALAMLLYEYGELCEHNWYPKLSGIIEYFGDIWNCFDCAGLALVLIWMRHTFVSSFSNELSNDSVNIFLGHVTLSCSAIFFSFGIMRYFSVYEPLGKLIMMVFAMCAELQSFMVIFCICIFGFCVCLHGLFKHLESFRSPAQTFLTLFSASLANFDPTFSSLADEESDLYTLGIIIEVSFISMSSIVLLNLVIARMSATHNIISDKSFQEWQFTKASTVRQFLLIEEKNPFSILPPPFNIITSLLAPLHFYFLHVAVSSELDEGSLSSHINNSNSKDGKVITVVGGAVGSPTGEEDQENADGDEVDNKIVITSLAGTCADMLLGLVLSPVAPIYEYASFVSQLSVKELFEIEAFCVFLLFPVMYIPYVLSLWMESLNARTEIAVARVSEKDDVDLENSNAGAESETADRGQKYEIISEVQFEQKIRCKPTKLTRLLRDADSLSINILGAVNLRNCKKDSNPIVKIRVGDEQCVTKASLYGGTDPVWLDETMNFCLNLEDIKRSIKDGSVMNYINVEVVDKDRLTGDEIVVGECIRNSIDIRGWLGNGKFKGSIFLDGNKGTISVDVECCLPSMFGFGDNIKNKTSLGLVKDSEISARAMLGQRKPSLVSFAISQPRPISFTKSVAGVQARGSSLTRLNTASIGAPNLLSSPAKPELSAANNANVGSGLLPTVQATYLTSLSNAIGGEFMNLIGAGHEAEQQGERRRVVNRRPSYFQRKVNMYEHVHESEAIAAFVKMFAKDRDRIFLPALRNRGVISPIKVEQLNNKNSAQDLTKKRSAISLGSQSAKK